MKSKNIGALLLIIFGAYFLSKNLRILPSWGVFWPLVIIVAGTIGLYQARARKGGSWEIDGNSSLFKAVGGLVVFLVVGFAALIIFGIIGPAFLLFLLFLPLILVFALGAAFLKLLIPLLFLAAPIILVIFLLSLVF